MVCEKLTKRDPDFDQICTCMYVVPQRPRLRHMAAMPRPDVTVRASVPVFPSDGTTLLVRSGLRWVGVPATLLPAAGAPGSSARAPPPDAADTRHRTLAPYRRMPATGTYTAICAVPVRRRWGRYVHTPPPLLLPPPPHAASDRLRRPLPLPPASPWLNLSEIQKFRVGTFPRYGQMPLWLKASMTRCTASTIAAFLISILCFFDSSSVSLNPAVMFFSIFRATSAKLQ